MAPAKQPRLRPISYVTRWRVPLDQEGILCAFENDSPCAYEAREQGITLRKTLSNGYVSLSIQLPSFLDLAPENGGACVLLGDLTTAPEWSVALRLGCYHNDETTFTQGRMVTSNNIIGVVDLAPKAQTQLSKNLWLDLIFTGSQAGVVTAQALEVEIRERFSL